MLSIGIITLFPEMFAALHYGVSGRTLNSKLAELCFWNPYDYATDKHHTVDDRSYGGGPGMVMKFEPLAAAFHAAKKQLGDSARSIYLSPQGKPLTQEALIQDFLPDPRPIILVAGRYEGIDERFIEAYITEEWSVGDYILSGGELAAMTLIDAILRLLPNALGHADSASQDSFSNPRLDHPHYTRPAHILDRPVPEVLLTGNHQAIATWRLKHALGKTWQKRPDLLKRDSLNKKEYRLLQEFIEEHPSSHHKGP